MGVWRGYLTESIASYTDSLLQRGVAGHVINQDTNPVINMSDQSTTRDLFKDI